MVVIRVRGGRRWCSLQVLSRHSMSFFKGFYRRLHTLGIPEYIPAYILRRTPASNMGILVDTRL